VPYLVGLTEEHTEEIQKFWEIFFEFLIKID
jgi:hypothetical protein